MNESGPRKKFDPRKFRRRIRPEKWNDLSINPEFRDVLVESGFTDFDSVWNFSGGEVFKDIEHRSVARVRFGAEGSEKTFYLKRHRAERIEKIPRLFSFRDKRPRCQGPLEFDNIIRFREHGLATAPPVAAGEKRVGASSAISFLLTEDFFPFVSLEWLLFNRPDYFTGPGAPERKKVLLKKIGRFARQMHDAGFNHKDFNATHILLGFPGNFSGEPEIALFDLQRVDRNKLFRFRWVVKSLAELNYTLFDEYFTDEDRERLFLFYQGKKAAGACGRFQQRWIRRKTARIARHTRNIEKRRRKR